MDDPSAIAGLDSAEAVELETADRTKAPSTAVCGSGFPPQPTDTASSGRRLQAIGLLLGSATAIAGWADVVEFDRDAGSIDAQVERHGARSSASCRASWCSTSGSHREPKPDALSRIWRTSYSTPVTRRRHRCRLDAATLRPPRFVGGGPASGVFTDDLDECMQWVLHLDRPVSRSRAPRARVRRARVHIWSSHSCKAGERVGITAMSHHAIDNLLREVLEVFTDDGGSTSLNAVGVEARESTPKHACVAHASTTTDAAEDRLQRGRRDDLAVRQQGDMRASPVDVLIIDEAGQLGTRRCPRRLGCGRQRRAVRRSAAAPAGGSGLAPRAVAV